ncbi:hypothetical protein [Glutamicibacter nicotianae]|uniref:hypothetical protein n=1 Tax=Glutamicibacter nicotianae TaxID=37929 RepID=UPI00195A2513|nr:hypothetical protein [Glutamicibacter nicotianae]MBM7766589.1 hypothetical protein [Glutamicibacter nicotianae]
MEKTLVVGTGGWGDQELEVLISEYFEMLRAELNGNSYVKRRHNEVVVNLTGRTASSVEFKFCNLSAVLIDLGLPYIRGYKPRSNYQKRLFSLAEQRIDEISLNGLSQKPVGEDGPELMYQGSLETESRNTNVAAFQSAPLETRTNSISVSQLGNEEQSGEADFWQRVSNLWTRATGGESVADRPETVGAAQSVNDPLAHLEGPRPAGLKEAGEWFASGLQETDVPRMLFLVGGPGAGKSHMARNLTAGLQRVSPSDDYLAHRTYEYAGNKLPVKLVNDATIPSDDYPVLALANEISDALNSRSHLVACVNRGMLVEEIQEYGKSQRVDDTINLSAEMIRRINDPENSIHASGQWSFELKNESSYIQSGTVKFDGSVYSRVVIVYVDVCSLLEPRPWVEILNDGEIVYQKYPFSTASKTNDELTNSAAGKLLSSVIDYLDMPHSLHSEAKTNPVLANILTLSNTQMRSGLLEILRSAEIYTGSRFTYREIWGAFVRSIVGYLPDTILPDDVIKSGRAGEVVLHGSPIKQFELMMAAGDIRISNSLYGMSCMSNSDLPDPRKNPVTRLTCQIDPLRDSLAGRISDPKSHGWASPVADALSGYGPGESPLKALVSDQESTANDLVAHGITSFELELDESFRKVFEDPRTKEKDRAKYVNWYGAYLTRFYALYQGIPAFRRDIELWRQTWKNSPQIPKALESGLRTLMRPSRNPEDSFSRSLLPVLDSRTAPIVGSVVRPKLALSTENYELETKANGEDLQLELKEGGRVVGSISLDLALVREANACSLNYSGVTELSETTLPRLERVRSARLVPENLTPDKYRIVDGNKDYIVNVNPVAVNILSEGNNV